MVCNILPGRLTWLPTDNVSCSLLIFFLQCSFLLSADCFLYNPVYPVYTAPCTHNDYLHVNYVPPNSTSNILSHICLIVHTGFLHIYCLDLYPLNTFLPLTTCFCETRPFTIWFKGELWQIVTHNLFCFEIFYTNILWLQKVSFPLTAIFSIVPFYMFELAFSCSYSLWLVPSRKIPTLDVAHDGFLTPTPPGSPLKAWCRPLLNLFQDSLFRVFLLAETAIYVFLCDGPVVQT
jgi:hypothetical protein